jgi:uncharacterized protein YuzE
MKQNPNASGNPGSTHVEPIPRVGDPETHRINGISEKRWGPGMNVKYDPETDSLMIVLRTAKIRESDEISPCVIADYGLDGEIVSFEVMHASTFVEMSDLVKIEQSA